MLFRFALTEIAVNVANRAELMRHVAARFAARQGFALATINLDHLVKLAASPSFRHAYAAQDLIVADGNPIVWLSRLAKRPVELVPGSDMIVPLVRLAQQKGIKVALLGSTEAALVAVSTTLKAQIAGLEIPLCIAPPMGFDPESMAAAEMLATLAAQDIGLCLLALGAPKQEILAARGRGLAPKIGFASIGAGLDFMAGNQHRAPDWMRKYALEWLWRLASSPRRLTRRYAACAAILPSETIKALRLRG